MKVRAGAHLDSGRVHIVSVMPANVSDINRAWCAGGPVLDRVVHGQQAAPADRGEQALQPQHVFDPRARRARVSRHQAPVPLHEGGYKGIAKNAARGVSPFGLTDLYLATRALTS